MDLADQQPLIIQNTLREELEQRHAAIMAIPAALKELGYVVWRRQQKVENGHPVFEADGSPKLVKMPYNPRAPFALIQQGDSRAYARANDPSTWATLDEAWRVLERLSATNFSADTTAGIGPVLTAKQRVVCIDLDRVLDDDHELRRFTGYLVKHLGSFAEVSQSGRGVHIFVYADLPDDVIRGKKAGGVEVYGDTHYIAMTGNTQELRKLDIVQPSTRVVEATEEVLALLGVMQTREKLGKRMAGRKDADRALLKLWNGDCSEYENDHSRADLALCGILGYETGYDARQMDLLFRMSGLYREKWDEYHHRDGQNNARTYGEMTVTKIVGDHAGRVQRRADLAAQLGLNDVDLLTSAEPSESGYKECFVRMFTGRLLYNATDELWMEYKNGAWVENENKNIGMLYAEQVVAARKAAALTLDDADARNFLLQHAVSMNSAAHHSAIARMAANNLMVTNRDLDVHDDWILAANGVAIHLPTGDTRPATPEDRFSLQLGAAYDPDATCPRWEQFMREILPDAATVAYMQRAFGYALTTSYEEQALFLLTGAGSNGKSRMLKTGGKVLGTYGGTASFETFEAEKNGGHNESLANLRGKRYVTMMESNEGKRLNEAKVKTATGGDVVSASRKFGHEFNFTVTAKFFLSVNRKPRIIGTDNGIWRRIHLVEFNQTFSEEAGNIDKHLDKKLDAELSGILNWMLAGHRQWQELDGLAPPMTTTTATKAYREESDSLTVWLEECATLGEDEKALVDDAYTNYKKWSEQMGEFVLGRNTWSDRMRERGFEKRKFKGPKVFGQGKSDRWYFVGMSVDVNVDLTRKK